MPSSARTAYAACVANPGWSEPPAKLAAEQFICPVAAGHGECRSKTEIRFVANHQAETGAETHIGLAAGLLKRAQHRIGVGAVLKRPAVEFHGADERYVWQNAPED